MEMFLNSTNRVTVESKKGTGRQLTGPTIAGGPLFTSDSHRKSLPAYLRTPKGSCHDYCKFGIRYVTEDDSKGSSINSLGEEVQHKDPHRVNNLNLKETRNRHAGTKPLLNVDKLNVIKKKTTPVFEESTWMKESVNFKRISTVKHAIASVSSKGKGNQGREMDNENLKCESGCKSEYQPKEPASPLKKTYSPGKRNMLKKTPAKGSTKSYENCRFKLRASLASNRIDTVAHLAKANTTTVRIESQPAIKSSNSSSNEAHARRNISGMPRMVEKESVKLQMPSHSYKHANNESCLEAMINNQKFGMVKPDEENKESKTTSAIQPKFDCDSDDLKPVSKKENYDFVSLTQISWKLEGIQDSSQAESPEPECVDFSLAELSSPMDEENYSNCIEKESSNDWSSHSLAYDEETEESHSAITELTEPEDETEEVETSSDTIIDESDSAISEFSEVEGIKSGSDTKTSMIRERRLTETASVHPEEHLSVPYMSMFRRSILHMIESGHCGQVVRKGFRQMPTLEVPSNLDPEAAAVVLRHQDVQQKTELLGLSNNVIEETASQLDQNTNTKVQALVRAFETVISLHSPR
ncbi:uncharacterized protein LOC122034087 [Zingiber officinale]|nr:uncharacterized protein LOC122034087 [Zingiber officinale]